MTRDLDVLDRFLTLWILLAMAAGLLFGRVLPGVAEALDAFSVAGTSLPIAAGLFAMLYPIMARVDYRAVPKVSRTARREIGVTLGFNWTVAPFLMYGLAWLFLRNHPGLLTGLVLVGIAPCIAMVLVWNDLAGGNQEMCAICVGVNSVLQVLLFVPYAFLLLTVLQGSAVEADLALVARTVLVFLGLPLVLGYGTQRAGFATVGREAYFSRFVPRISPVGLMGLLFTVLVMFALKGEHVLADPLLVGLVAAPLLLFFAGIWTAAYLVSSALGFSYREGVSIAFTAGSNNFELAIAVAVAAFGVASDAALATVIGPLIEVPVMLALVKVALATRYRLFTDGEVCTVE
ncbi:MAG: hypothetical protein MAG715_00970 [Methanonatronarchaeales archaeon]|nr:hypothetical protein [Methanonatronarchaeales archaeon]